MATIKKSTTVKKAQKGTMTPMQKLKKMYPSADTTAKGDLRFADLAPLDRYGKKDQKKIMDTQAAFNKKYGKGKPAMKMGGVVKKTKKMGGKMSKKK